jgi:hypothetical protein
MSQATGQTKTKKKRAKGAESPDLLERVFGAGCTRLAVISMHAGAGARTVVETLAEDFRRRGIRVGVAGVPRVDLDAERITGISLPEETIVATATSVLSETDALEPLERVDSDPARDELSICRVTRSGEVAIYGPDDAPTLNTVLTRIEAWSEGFVLVAGAWERRSFAAPEVSSAVVLAVGSSSSGSPERSAAAVRHDVEILGLSRYELPVDVAWREADRLRVPLVLDRHGRMCQSLLADADPVPALQALGETPTVVVLPDFLSDNFLAPLVRSNIHCSLVVKDATRVRVSPVYYTAWLKRGGRVAVMEPMQVLAVATNPTSSTGPDTDPHEFRCRVAEALPDIPVHDVPLESAARDREPLWKFWTRSPSRREAE